MILREVAEAHDSVAQLQSQPRGTLRVHSRMLVGHLHVVRGHARIPQRLSRRCYGRVEPEEILDLPQWVGTETIRTHLDTLGE